MRNDDRINAITIAATIACGLASTGTPAAWLPFGAALLLMAYLLAVGGAPALLLIRLIRRRDL